MIVNPELIKTRIYCTQISDEIRIRCPECVRIKKCLQHCKIFKSLPSIWYHIKSENGEISNSDFKTEDVLEVFNNIARAMEWKIFPSSKNILIRRVKTTSSSLSFNGKPIKRADVWDRLERIANLLKGQSRSYPIFKKKQLECLIKTKLGYVDERTRKKYYDCIFLASKKDYRFGTIDVSGFCDEVAKPL